MKIFSANQIREWDAFTIQNEPISSTDLMERASITFTNWFVQQFPESNQKIHVFCGGGNNGGDGLAIARLLHRRFYEVKVFLVPMSRSKDFQINLKRLPRDIELNALEDIPFPEIEQETIIIDAILGSGLSRPIEGDLMNWIKQLNQLSNTKVSVDIPSGFFADKASSSISFIPHYTFSFQSPKLAFFFPENDEKIGNWTYRNIQLSKEFEAQTISHYHFITSENIKDFILPERKKFSHKGTFGHALLIAGAKGKTGAAVLAARACLKSGTGLLTCHIPKDSLDIMQISLPEAMCSLDQDKDIISSLPQLSPYQSIGMGPGIGKHQKTAGAVLGLLQNYSKPIILDADALNILSENKAWFQHIPENSILTPHPKEFERLFGSSKDSWERLETARKIVQKHQFIIVLKGANTCTILPNGYCYFNSTGNPGMATGGSGDVLTGIITGLLAQGYEASHAAIVGVYIHGLAGDFAAQTLGLEALLASDIIGELGRSFLDL